MEDLSRSEFFRHRGPQLCPRLHRTHARPGQAKAGAGSTATGPLDHTTTSVPAPHLEELMNNIRASIPPVL